MKTGDFDYNLPEELIAQSPLQKRDDSRLLVLDRQTGAFEDKHFDSILDYLKKGDVLVLNDTKVLPARIYGIKEKTGAHVQLLLLKEQKKDVWQCLVKPAKRVQKGTVLSFPNSSLTARCVEAGEDGIRIFQFCYTGIFYEILEKLGQMPLPPYIHERLEDQRRYQTVYAKHLGSAAAATAGLHFTEELLEKIRKKGVKIVSITLHVGLGTFRPVTVEDVTKHTMHSEYYEMGEDTAHTLNDAKKKGHAIVAVGTTSVRTLETIMQKYGTFQASSGFTDIFIYPGYTFLGVDHIITNFHLPKSTLLMLVSAFASKEQILAAYQHAVLEKYRFFSFGDSMLIW